MAFICPPRTELLKKRRILKGIKSVLQEIETDMAAKIQLQCQNGCCNSQPPNCTNPQPPNCCNQPPNCCNQPPSCCPPCCKPDADSTGTNNNGQNGDNGCQEDKPVPPDVMVCYKIEKKTQGKKKSKKREAVRLKQSKSRELRASNLYRGCFCEKRNGLQDDCPRTECHGKPECLTQPNPICGPSEFCDGKHLYKKQKQNQKARLGVVLDDSDAEDEEYEFQCFPGSIEQGQAKMQPQFCDLTNCPAYN